MNARMKNQIVLGFVSALLFLLPTKALAQFAITSPAPNSTVSGTVSFVCSNPGGTVGVYIDDIYVSGSPYAWDTTKVANGSYYLLCNGYKNGVQSGVQART
jgi:hypothetical protein